MFHKNWGRHKGGQNATDLPERDAANPGFAELEGDFEAERRRAAAGSHERMRPYEHGEGENAIIPGSIAGLTHP